MRRRRLWALGGLLALLAVGGIAGAQVGGSPTVATQTFTNVVTYTIPTETETVISTETVTVTAPTTTTEPPPPVGTRILVGPDQPEGRRGEWVCTQPVGNYATNGLPLIIETHTVTSAPGQNGDVRLMNGCVGDPSADPDIILEIHGDGAGLGSPEDMVNLGGPSPGPQNLQISGFGRCGRPATGSHPDAFQLQWGRNITVHDFQLGIWDMQTPGCHGAGGLWYVSGNDLRNIVCVRCRMVGTAPGGGAVGTGFYLGLSQDSGAIDSCFSANRPFAQDGQAVRGINTANLFIDRDAGTPQPSPLDC